MTRPRVATALAVCAASLLLTGCTASGWLTVNEDGSITYDITVEHKADEATEGEYGMSFGICTHTGWPEVTDLPAPRVGEVACRLRNPAFNQPGSTSLTGILASTLLTSSADQWILNAPSNLFGGGGDPDHRLDSYDLTITLPGRVVAVTGGGTVKANTVHFRGGPFPETGLGAASRQGADPWWVGLGTGGLGVTVGAVGGVALWRRRQRLANATPLQPVDADATPAASDGEVAHEDEQTPITPASDPPGEDDAIWAPESGPATDPPR